MSMLLDSTFCVVSQPNEHYLNIFKKNNMIGYITFQDELNNKITKEIIINKIFDVINTSNNKILDTFASFSFYKNIEKRKLFFLKENYQELIHVKNGLYSQDFYSDYAPFGLIPIELIKLTEISSIESFSFEYNKDINKLFV